MRDSTFRLISLFSLSLIWNQILWIKRISQRRLFSPFPPNFWNKFDQWNFLYSQSAITMSAESYWDWVLTRDKENREMRRKVESRNPWLFFYLVIYLVVPNIGVAWRNPFASSLCSPYLWSALQMIQRQIFNVGGKHWTLLGILFYFWNVPPCSLYEVTRSRKLYTQEKCVLDILMNTRYISRGK